MNKSYTSPDSASSKKYSGSQSPVTGPDAYAKVLGGIPTKKSIDQINDANDPAKRGKAPNAARGV